ncbi:hypothetical protein ACMZ4W_00337 [Brevundimonas naejangsanensis]
MGFHQVEGLADAGQHPQGQDIDLHQAQGVDVVLVPFDEGAVRHGGVADGHGLVQPSLGQDEAPDMLGQVARKTQQARRHAHGAINHGIGGVQTGLLDLAAADLGAPAAPLGRGQAGSDVFGQAQDLADFADGAAGAIADDGGGDAGAMTAIALIDVLDDLLAPLMLEVHVDVGRLVAVGGQETLEQQVVAGRIDAGDAQDVADSRVGG